MTDVLTLDFGFIGNCADDIFGGGAMSAANVQSITHHFDVRKLFQARRFLALRRHVAFWFVSGFGGLGKLRFWFPFLGLFFGSSLFGKRRFLFHDLQGLFALYNMG